MLRIGTTGTETRFLPESELPDCARLSGSTEEEVMETSAREAEERDVQKAILASRMPQNSGQLNGFKNLRVGNCLFNHFPNLFTGTCINF